MSLYLNDSMAQPLGMSRAYVTHSGNKRYYSSIDAQIYFDDVLINEIVQIQWSEQEGLMPIFGYNSYVWDEIAIGSRITTGVFAINFIVPDYLNRILEHQTSTQTQIANSGSKYETISVDDTKETKTAKATDNQITYKNTGKEYKSAKNTYKNKKNGFTIIIGYGDENYKDTITGTTPYIYLENVHVQSVAQAMDTSGGGIVEIYQFQARDRHYKR